MKRRLCCAPVCPKINTPSGGVAYLWGFFRRREGLAAFTTGLPFALTTIQNAGLRDARTSAERQPVSGRSQLSANRCQLAIDCHRPSANILRLSLHRRRFPESCHRNVRVSLAGEKSPRTNGRPCFARNGAEGWPSIHYLKEMTHYLCASPEGPSPCGPWGAALWHTVSPATSALPDTRRNMRVGVQVWLITMHRKTSTELRPINKSVSDRPASVAIPCQSGTHCHSFTAILPPQGNGVPLPYAPMPICHRVTEGCRPLLCA